MRDVQATGDAPLSEPPAGLAAGGTGAPERSTAGRPRRRLLAVTAVLVVLVDLGTKTLVVHDFGDGHVTRLIPGVLRVEESRNAGAAFGLATGATIIVSVVAVAVAAVIIRESRRLRSVPWAVALGLLLGGALGNLGDRVFRSPGFLRGRVVDWIALPHYPVFNLADSAITVGGILAVLLALSGRRLDGSRESPDQPVTSP